MAPPPIEEARGLTSSQLGAIADLERRVVAHDGGRLKLEWGVLRERPTDQMNDLLAWRDRTLVGFCGIYHFGGEPELAGAVDPDRRRFGIGSSLLSLALEHLARRGVSRVLLVTPAATDVGRRFALAQGATLDHSEHHLELDGPPKGSAEPRATAAGLLVRPARDGADAYAIAPILRAAFGESSAYAGQTAPSDLALVVERDGDVVGALRLDLSGEPAGIYGLAVRPDVRGQGIGRAVLHEACLEARRRGARTVSLEVETDNDHALGLYTSVGFELRATEDYFALPVASPRHSAAGW